MLLCLSSSSCPSHALALASPDLELLPRDRCDVRELHGAPTPDEMAVVVNSHLPVVWRGGAKALGLDRVLWSADKLLEKYGECVRAWGAW